MKTSDYLEPVPGAIVESLRAIGYTMETAVADIIDNSITAHAKRVDIDCDLNGSSLKFFILDNGDGMDEKTLHEAMRLGGNGPKEKRKSNDLGRFGLGLKTASFSQCRRLTVISKTLKGINQRCWDLDTIVEKGWKIDKSINENYAQLLSEYSTGTLVVWEKIDVPIQSKDAQAEKIMAAKISDLRSHLGLVFHRFLEKDLLKIYTGGSKIFPWNPFLPDIPPEQKILNPKEEIANSISIESVVLPHRSYFKSDSAYRAAGHIKGWTHMQGFYIYRNDRLLTVAGWMGLRENGKVMRQDRFYDLARISIDLTNEDDFNWDIDVKKSKATPPGALIEILSAIASNIRKVAYEVYRKRNCVNVFKKKTDVTPLWEVDSSSGKLRLSLNQNFPAVSNFINSLDESQRRDFVKLLKLISETVPADDICLELDGSNSVQMSQPYEDMIYDDYTEDLILAYTKCGYSREDAIEQIKILLNQQ